MINSIPFTEFTRRCDEWALPSVDLSRDRNQIIQYNGRVRYQNGQQHATNNASVHVLNGRRLKWGIPPSSGGSPWGFFKAYGGWWADKARVWPGSVHLLPRFFDRCGVRVGCDGALPVVAFACTGPVCSEWSRVDRKFKLNFDRCLLCLPAGLSTRSFWPDREYCGTVYSKGGFWKSKSLKVVRLAPSSVRRKAYGTHILAFPVRTVVASESERVHVERSALQSWWVDSCRSLVTSRYIPTGPFQSTQSVCRDGAWNRNTNQPASHTQLCSSLRTRIVLCCRCWGGLFYYSVRSINAKNELIRPGPSGLLEEGMVWIRAKNGKLCKSVRRELELSAKPRKAPNLTPVVPVMGRTVWIEFVKWVMQWLRDSVGAVDES